MERKREIELTSRSDDDRETKEMTSFLNEVEAMEADHLLVKLFYDSKAGLCIVETVDKANEHPDAVFLWQAARNNLSQFQLFGVIGHCCR